MNHRGIYEVECAHFGRINEEVIAWGKIVYTMDDGLFYIAGPKDGEKGYVAYEASEIDPDIFVHNDRKPRSEIFQTENAALEWLCKRQGGDNC